jgi:hypothetical protein
LREKQTETAKPTLKELLLSDSDRFDLEIPARGKVKNLLEEITKKTNDVGTKLSMQSTLSVSWEKV